MPPAPKCLTRSRFVPDVPTYQDIWQQPLLMMVAYARVLQYWVEWANLPVQLDDCLLALNVVELMWQVRGHITFYKWDINPEPGESCPRSCEQRSGNPPRVPHCPAYPNQCQRQEVRLHGTPLEPLWHTELLFFSPVEKAPQVIPLPTGVDVGHTPPGPADIPLGRGAMPILAKPEVETLQDTLTSQATSSIRTIALPSHVTRPKMKGRMSLLLLPQ